MRRALEVARSVWGTTHPNPMVGAVIVEEGRVVPSRYLRLPSSVQAGGVKASLRSSEARS